MYPLRNCPNEWPTKANSYVQKVINLGVFSIIQNKLKNIFSIYSHCLATLLYIICSS